MNLTPKQVRELLPDHLQYYPIPYGTPEWYEFRKSGLGGSDMGVITRTNPYETIMATFAEKVGTANISTQEFERTWHGRMHEPYIADTCWAYYDGAPMSHVHNHIKGEIIRNSYSITGYIVNPKYPWIFASPDRLIDPNTGFNLFSYSSLKGLCPLELKNLSYWGGKVWADGYPEYYIPQVQTYMLVMEVDYCEIAMLRDGNEFVVEPIRADKELQDTILHLSEVFWKNHIVPAKEAYNVYLQAKELNNYDMMERALGTIQRLEPEPDGTENYKKYLNYNFLKERETMAAPSGLYNVIKRRTMINELIKALTSVRNKLDSAVIRQHIEDKVEFMMYPEGASSRYYMKKGNKNHELRVDVKEKPTLGDIERQLEKIELDYLT